MNSGGDGAAVDMPLVEMRLDDHHDKVYDDRRKTPMLVLTSAAKRKSSVF